MRPASEIHSALDLLRSELARLGPAAWEMANTPDDVSDAMSGAEQEAMADRADHWHHMSLAASVLEWVTGGRAPTEGSAAWLCGFLLDDPPQIGHGKPEDN